MRPLRLSGVSMIVMGMLSLICCPMGQAEDAEKPYTFALDPKTVVFPELLTAPAPDLIKHGLRIQYQTMHAALSPIAQGSGGAAGYAQYDIVGTLPDAIAVQMTLIGQVPLMFGQDPANPVLYTMAPNGFVTNPGGGDVWMAPKVLAKFASANGEGITHQRVDYDAAGKTYHAICTTTESGQGKETVYRDSESGLILHRSSTITAADGTQIEDQSTLVSIRTIETPWDQAETPAILNDINVLTYEGTEAAPAIGIAMPKRMTMKIAGRGKGFVQILINTSSNAGLGWNNEPEYAWVSTTAELMPIAIPVEAIAKLEKGQVIDRDPVTKVVTWVEEIPAGGNNHLVIFARAPGDNQPYVSATFNGKSGIRQGMSWSNPVLGNVTTMKLTKVDQN